MKVWRLGRHTLFGPRTPQRNRERCVIAQIDSFPSEGRYSDYCHSFIGVSLISCLNGDKRRRSIEQLRYSIGVYDSSGDLIYWPPYLRFEPDRAPIIRTSPNAIYAIREEEQTGIRAELLVGQIRKSMWN